MEKLGSSEYPLLLNLEELKRDFLPMLQEWKDSYLDDYPDHTLKPGDPEYYKFKCPTDWFNAFEKTLRLCVPHMVDPLHSEIVDYIENEFTQIDWQAMRTREEIERANQILEKATAWLEQQ